METGTYVDISASAIFKTCRYIIMIYSTYPDKYLDKYTSHKDTYNEGSKI